MTKLPRTLRLRSLAVRTLRVTSYLAVVVAGLSVVGVRAVHARSKSAALAIGEPLAALELPEGGGNHLTLNGVRLHLATAHVDADVKTTLDRLQRGCEGHADGLADDLGALGRDFATSAPSTRGFPGVGMLRDEREGRGVVACFATGEETSEVGLARRLATLARTSDLSDLGHLRYVAVHEDAQGGVKVTATWSNDAVALGAMFPASGDASGDDPRLAPRPAGGQRLLSAHVDPAPYGAWVYAMEVAPEAALGAYDVQLVGKGWKPVTSTATARTYQNGLVDVLVTASGGAEGTTLSIIESSYAVAQAKGASR